MMYKKQILFCVTTGVSELGIEGEEKKWTGIGELR